MHSLGFRFSRRTYTEILFITRSNGVRKRMLKVSLQPGADYCIQYCYCKFFLWKKGFLLFELKINLRCVFASLWCTLMVIILKSNEIIGEKKTFSSHNSKRENSFLSGKQNLIWCFSSLFLEYMFVVSISMKFVFLLFPLLPFVLFYYNL